jgi:hypothetical protein
MEQVPVEHLNPGRLQKLGLGDTITMPSAFLDNKGVMGTIQLLVLMAEAKANPILESHSPPKSSLLLARHVCSTPPSPITMISGCITPVIMQEALRRTPNHKAAGPDGVPEPVLKPMPLAFHEALHLLFQSMAITGITPPHDSKATLFSSTKKVIPRGWIITAPSHWSMLFASSRPPL